MEGIWLTSKEWDSSGFASASTQWTLTLGISSAILLKNPLRIATLPDQSAVKTIRTNCWSLWLSHKLNDELLKDLCSGSRGTFEEIIMALN